jgi:DNA polymerase III epsilon subunit-like protein
MKYVVIDTETSGLFDFSKPADAEGQPRLASLAMVFLDEEMAETGRVHMLVKPDGWEMSEETAKINGLTMDILNEHGVPVSEAIAAYGSAIDEGCVVVAFNAQYDTKIMRGEMRRAEVDDRFERTPNICAMRALVDICQIPKKTGRGFKFPKLSEACAHFEIENEAEHSAKGDADACVRLLRKLHELGKLPEPAVYYAKVAPERPVAA